MSMTKMDNACSAQADLCDLRNMGTYYILEALSAGRQALDLLEELEIGACCVGDVRIRELLGEWN